MLHNVNVQVSKCAMVVDYKLCFRKHFIGTTFQILAKMADTDVPEIELIIKASTIDGRRKGACIFCQVIV